MNLDHSIMTAITQVNVTADLGRMALLMGMPGPDAFDEQLLNQLGRIRVWCAEHVEPQLRIRSLPIASIEPHSVRVVNGSRFRIGSSFCKQLRGSRASGVILVGLTLGSGISSRAKRLWDEGRIDESYLLSTYGAALTETLATRISSQLCHWTNEMGLGLLPQQGPGYNDWPTEHLTDLYEVLMESNSTSLCEFRVSPAGALQPAHSLLIAYGLTHQLQATDCMISEYNPCHTCRLPDCAFRRSSSDTLASQHQLLESIA